MQDMEQIVTKLAGKITSKYKNILSSNSNFVELIHSSCEILGEEFKAHNSNVIEDNQSVVTHLHSATIYQYKNIKKNLKFSKHMVPMQ